MGACLRPGPGKARSERGRGQGAAPGGDLPYGEGRREPRGDAPGDGAHGPAPGDGTRGPRETAGPARGVPPRMTRNALTCGGCAVSAVGAGTALTLWGTSSRTRRHLGQGFENEGMDLGAAVAELPFVFLAGALLPALLWGAAAWLLTRGRGRSADLDR